MKIKIKPNKTIPKQTNPNKTKREMLEQFLPIFMRDNSVSDWPSSQYNISSHPSVGCLANQRHSFPPWKRRETESSISLLRKCRKYKRTFLLSFYFLKFNLLQHMQICDTFGLSFLHTLVSIIFPTGNACVPVDESPPFLYIFQQSSLYRIQK